MLHLKEQRKICLRFDKKNLFQENLNDELDEIVEIETLIAIGSTENIGNLDNIVDQITDNG